MEIGYKEILEIYKNSSRVFICHALTTYFITDLRDINTHAIMKQIGIQVYGGFWGRVKFYLHDRRCLPPMLECIYPDLAQKLGISWAEPMIFDIIHNKKYPTEHVRRQYRIEVLQILAERFPNTKFKIED